MLNSNLSKIVLAATVITLTACGGGGSSTETNDSGTSDSSSSSAVNTPPTVSAGTDIQTRINTPTMITGTAIDVDGVISQYEWSKNGEVLATTLNFTYTPTQLGTETLTLTVTDDDGATASDSRTVEILEDLEELEEFEDTPLPF